MNPVWYKPISIQVRLGPIAIGMALGMIGSSFGLRSAQTPKTDHEYSYKRMEDGKEWTTRNLSLRSLPSYCYEGQEIHCQKYGGLYTFEAARGACAFLGDGWRLPTDDEWRRLAKKYGGVSADSADKGKAAYKALLSGGSSEFNGLLGGGRSGDGEYARLEAHGFYWTATEVDPRNAIFYNFGRGGLALHRQDSGEKESAFSVRCIRE